ncbi:MAG TPA: hypothetical protein VNB22_18875 [Pyrinomonadaceae bacterium]|nr:hypothetical protein [Pyrinomonadaceae bacterium]
MKENLDADQQPKKQNSPGCPYVGLMPFTEKDAEYFFGRETEIQNVATNLRASSLTIFYGGSGVGKSSLLNAGVIPYLQKIAANSVLPGKPADFISVVLREWANNPLDELKLRIKLAVERAVKENMIPHLAMTEVENLARDSKDNNDLSTLLKNWTSLTKTDLLIILDQFEDFFLHPEFFSGKGMFGEEFPRAVNYRELPVNFLISLRADAIDKLDFFKGTIPNLMKNTLRLLPLDREATKEAICQPLCKYNEKMGTSFEIKPHLVEKLLDDLRVDKIKFDTQGQANISPSQIVAVTATNESSANGSTYRVETPYLQLVMVRLWEHEITQRKQRLSLYTLIKKLGGVQEIVENHLDKVMEQFSDEEKDLAARFIHFTVTRSGTKIPLSAADLTELAELEESQRTAVEDILRRLSRGDNSIFKVVPNRRNHENPFYEVAHDALGPAILSWRKRENETKRRRLALEEEKKKRQEELAEIEAKQRVELAEQSARLKVEEEKRLTQEKLLNIERRNQKLVKRLAILSNIVFILVALSIAAFGYIYYEDYKEAKEEKRTALVNANVLTQEKDEVTNERDIYANKANELQADVDKKTESEAYYRNARLAEDYETEIDSYKSLINILLNLQTGSTGARNSAMNRIKARAEAGTLPEQYKPLFIDALKKVEVDASNAPLRDQTLAAIENSQMKPPRNTLDRKTIIFIHYQKPDQEPNASKVKNLLVKKGYIIPGMEYVGIVSSIKQTQLRFFRDGDETRADEICRYLKDIGIGDVLPRRVKGYENSPLVRSNQFELWFTGDPIPEIR